MNKVLNKMQKRIMLSMVAEVNTNGGGYFKEYGKHIAFNLISEIQDYNIHATRDLDVHPVIGGWIKDLNNQLSFKTATPKNYSWYKKCYVVPWDSDKSLLYHESIYNDGCWRARFEKKGYCSLCENGYQFEKIYLPNGSHNCIDYFISNIYEKSNSAWLSKTILHSRYLMSGKVGEGKSAFINFMLSTYQEKMWLKRFIPIRLAMSRADFWDPYQKILENKSGDQAKADYIKNTIYRKIVRILSTKYFCANISVPVDNDYSLLIPEEFKDLIGFQYMVSRDLVSTCFLEFKDVYPEQEKINKLRGYKFKDIGQIELANDVGRLLKKYDFSLSKSEKDSVLNFVSKKVEIDKSNNVFSFFDTPIEKSDSQEISNDIIIETINALGSLSRPYRYFIILDGLDPHNQNKTIESAISELINDLIKMLFFSSTNIVQGSYMLVMREETINRNLLSARFPGSLWGDIVRMKVAPVAPCDIFGKRLFYMSDGAYQKAISVCFVNFCSHYFNYVLSGSPVKEKYDLDRRDDGGFKLLSMLFRGNRRTMLKFMNIFIRDIHNTIQKKGIDFDLIEKRIERKTESDAKYNAYEYYNKIIEPYTFWDSVLYKKNIVYYNPIHYSISESSTSSGVMKRLERTFRGVDNEYEVFPNIFNCVPIKESMENKGLSYIKILIMNILAAAKYMEINDLIAVVNELYGFSDLSQIRFEIDELMVHRFIDTDIHEKTENPALKVSIYWKEYEKLVFQHEVFAALSSDVMLPDKNVFRFYGYCSYVSRKYEWLSHRESSGEWRDVTKKSFASKIITMSIVLSYLAVMDWFMRQRYAEKRASMIEIADVMGRVEYDNISISNGLKKVAKELNMMVKNSNRIYVEHFEEIADEYMKQAGLSDSKIGIGVEDILFNDENEWWNKIGEMIQSDSVF